MTLASWLALGIIACMLVIAAGFRFYFQLKEYKTLVKGNVVRNLINNGRYYSLEYYVCLGGNKYKNLDKDEYRTISEIQYLLGDWEKIS